MTKIYETHLTGNCYLRANTRLDTMAIYDYSVSESIICVPSTVFAVGWNENFVIAKRHPKDQPLDPLEPVLEKIYWYILDLRNYKGLCPPIQLCISEAEFLSSCERMGVPNDLTFSIIFDELDPPSQKPTLTFSVIKKAKERIHNRQNRQWLKKSVRFFKSLHFFQDFAHLKDSDFIDQIMLLYQEKFDYEISPKTELIDLQLLSFDTKRIWWDDTEADVASGNNVYTHIFQQWATISRNVFKPTNIQEIWQSEKGSITVEFLLNGEPCTVQPNYLDDYIDVNVLSQINELIVKTSYQFAVYIPFDQTSFVLVLSEKEKKALQNRRWKFLI